MAAPEPFVRRADAAVLAVVALLSGAVLLLGDRFETSANDRLVQPVHVEARIAACVGDETMRLINPDRERCHPGERELTPPATEPAAGGAAR